MNHDSSRIKCVVITALALISSATILIAIRGGLVFPSSNTTVLLDARAVKKRPDKIEWLHFPKAGTSFGNLLINWACPEGEPRVWITKEGVDRDIPGWCLARFSLAEKLYHENGMFFPIGEHHILNRSDEELGSVFATVRNPRTRLPAAFHNRFGVQRLNATQYEICSSVDRSLVVHFHKGSQVKMINGGYHFIGDSGLARYTLNSGEQPTAEQVEKACARLRRFAFVGITDYWEATVCLFHAEFGGRAIAADFVNVRPGPQPGARVLKYVDCGDTADDSLFRCAMEVFLLRIEQHPQCVRHLIPNTL